MLLALAALLFALFTANVAAGSMRGTPFIGDVGEMLLLFGAAIAFVAAFSRAEKRRDERLAERQRATPSSGETHEPD